MISHGRWIIYPETRFISYDQLVSWLKDDIANGDVLLNTGLDINQTDVDKMHINDIVKLLEDGGSVTFADPKTPLNHLEALQRMERMERTMEYYDTHENNLHSSCGSD